MEMKSNPLPSVIYGGLVRMSRARNQKFTSAVWCFLWKLSCFIFSKTTVSTILHDRKVLLNYGYPYLIYARCCPLYNQGLLELIHQCYKAKQEPIVLVDVGAAIGDTILLALSNASAYVVEFYAIEGDETLFRYLKHNLKPFKQGHLIHQVLSDKEGEERSLRKISAGTVSAQGLCKVQATTLDVLLLDSKKGPEFIDVLKTDVDGLDGKVLSGSQKIFQRYHPAVIFEWHPRLYIQTGNDWKVPFKVLGESGYDRFLWLTKFGAWSHATQGFDEKAIQAQADLCLRMRRKEDWHYDIVALHESSPINSEEFSRFAFSQKRISPW